MFNSASRRLFMAHKRYMFYYDRNVGKKPNFKVGDFVFVDRPPNTTADKDKNVTVNKLQPRTLGPFEVAQVFDTVLVLREGDWLVPTNINRCRIAPQPRNVPPNPNHLDGPSEPRTVAAETELTDNGTRNDTHHESTKHILDENENHFVVRLVDHVAHENGSISYRVQFSDLTFRDNVEATSIPHRLVIQYWHRLAKRKGNPHNRNRGRPRKEGTRYAPTSNRIQPQPRTAINNLLNYTT